MNNSFIKKTLISAIIFTVLICSGCSKKTKVACLKDVPDDYTLDDAKKDHMVVYEDLDITSGQEQWDEFLSKCEKKEKASILLAFYYTLGDASQYSPELYNEVKDTYPMLYIQQLDFDGSAYTISSYEDGELNQKQYSNLVRYEGVPESTSALYSYYVYYVLVNDPTVTWHDIWQGMISSKIDAGIEHATVYYDVTPK